ncbi:flagellar biosynthetic protein FliO [Cryptosporangium sp. NPDC048952]|uniref:flagellar biosynthetic protein FliO n=1 Tax=Cryptosporangium sp. NPDC048952 TaxID=3363961 RepID=UPI00371FE2A0
MIEATLRAIFSLTVVLFLMWGLARLVRRPSGGRGLASLSVLSRQPLSRGASVAVVKVDDRALVLGVTDAQVTYLTETPLSAFERPAFADVLADHTDDVLEAKPNGPLAGSVLSPATWTQVAGFVRERASRQR